QPLRRHPVEVGMVDDRDLAGLDAQQQVLGAPVDAGQPDHGGIVVGEVGHQRSANPNFALRMSWKSRSPKVTSRAAWAPAVHTIASPPERTPRSRPSSESVAAR